MAPSLISKKNQAVKEKDQKKYDKIRKTITEYQKFIKNNFQYVGDNFAYEARSIHYNNKKKSKNRIYGNATFQDLTNLTCNSHESRRNWIEIEQTFQLAVAVNRKSMDVLCFEQ